MLHAAVAKAKIPMLYDAQVRREAAVGADVDHGSCGSGRGKGGSVGVEGRVMRRGILQAPSLQALPGEPTGALLHDCIGPARPQAHRSHHDAPRAPPTSHPGPQV